MITCPCLLNIFFLLELIVVWFSHLCCSLHTYDELIPPVFLYYLYLLSVCSNSSSIPSVSSSWRTLSWRYLTHSNLYRSSSTPGAQPLSWCFLSLSSWELPSPLSWVTSPVSWSPCLSLPLFWWSSSSSFWELGAWEVNFLRLCVSENIFNLSPR